MFKAIKTISLLGLVKGRMEEVKQMLLKGQTLDKDQEDMLKSEFEVKNLGDTDNILRLIEVWLKHEPVHSRLLKEKEERE